MYGLVAFHIGIHIKFYCYIVHCVYFQDYNTPYVLSVWTLTLFVCSYPGVSSGPTLPSDVDRGGWGHCLHPSPITHHSSLTIRPHIRMVSYKLFDHDTNACLKGFASITCMRGTGNVSDAVIPNNMYATLYLVQLDGCFLRGVREGIHSHSPLLTLSYKVLIFIPSILYPV